MIDSGPTIADPRRRRRVERPAPDLSAEIWGPDHVRVHCGLPSNKAAFEWLRRSGARETPDRRSLRTTKRKFLAWLENEK
jgi:hypothetical protein